MQYNNVVNSSRPILIHCVFEKGNKRFANTKVPSSSSLFALVGEIMGPPKVPKMNAEMTSLRQQATSLPRLPIRAIDFAYLNASQNVAASPIKGIMFVHCSSSSSSQAFTERKKTTVQWATPKTRLQPAPPPSHPTSSTTTNENGEGSGSQSTVNDEDFLLSDHDHDEGGESPLKGKGTKRARKST